MVTAGELDLTDHQYSNLLTTVTVINTRPATRGKILAAQITVMTLLTESGMRMLANPHVPESLRYPHDDLGYDHASCGMVQQQTGYAWTTAGYGQPGVAAMNQTTMNSPDGWGTPAQLMTPAYCVNKFLEVMETRAWATQEPWVTAQQVQGSAYDGNPREANNHSAVYGGNYRDQWARAVQLVAAVWATPTTTPHAQEEEDMLIIFPVGQPGRPAAFDGSKATRITSGTTITGLRGAGIKTVAVDPADYSAFIAAGNR